MNNADKAKNSIKAVLWDMDGTLFNTERGIRLAITETMDTLGKERIPDEEIGRFIGPPIQESFVNICGMPREEALKAADCFRKFYREKGYVLESDPYPGIEECLKKLKENGFLIGVCTLKKQDMAESIIRESGMGPLFDSIVGTDAVDSIKKHDTIRMTCEKFDIPVSSAVLIGDTDFDSIGAEKAGCLFLGVTYGFGFKSAEDLSGYPNIGAASDVKEILEIIQGYTP